MLALSHIVPLQFEGRVGDALEKIKKSYRHRPF
jgi:hypothetical protein